jgi:hypothetical protein
MSSIRRVGDTPLTTLLPALVSKYTSRTASSSSSS